MIVPMVRRHAGQVLAIYQAGIDEGNATFETAAPDWAGFDAGKLPGHRFVALGSVGDGMGDTSTDTSTDAVPGTDVPAEMAAETAADVAGEAGAARDGGRERVLGWVAASAVSGRAAYRGVVEHSVYVAPHARGRGVAKSLLRELISSTEQAGIWTVQSGVFPENTASLALHEQLGFRRVGVRERIGRLHGVWRDVVLLERRSPAVD
ncbi:N-acetyltransferase [Kineosporia sp. J2-2]|uniref:N-acetyltransferase n=1 Tax=Kineosporia corallincola TaxID=2835133 RepID=A0ABS5TKE9_9ACTN|nr:GNAT family N-acetyltransferase [Kineosporia corallincola]MBT0771571.1 N-acetyltransferase [Kineosporia corallincola]